MNNYNINDKISNLIKQGNREDLENIFEKNEGPSLDINENLYRIAMEYNNVDAIGLLTKYDRKENILFHIENNPKLFNYIFKNEFSLSRVCQTIAAFYCDGKGCPQKLKNILRNEFTGTLSKRFIKILLRKNRIKFLQFFLRDYRYDNRFILDLLSYYRNRKPLSSLDLMNKIKFENSKIPFTEIINDLVSKRNLKIFYNLLNCMIDNKINLIDDGDSSNEESKDDIPSEAEDWIEDNYELVDLAKTTEWAFESLIDKLTKERKVYIYNYISSLYWENEGRYGAFHDGSKFTALFECQQYDF